MLLIVSVYQAAIAPGSSGSVEAHPGGAGSHSGGCAGAGTVVTVIGTDGMGADDGAARGLPSSRGACCKGPIAA